MLLTDETYPQPALLLLTMLLRYILFILVSHD